MSLKPNIFANLDHEIEIIVIDHFRKTKSIKNHYNCKFICKTVRNFCYTHGLLEI